MMNQSEKNNFLQLLQSCEKLVIPKIQRDYAQGRIDAGKTGFYSEIRKNFLSSLYQALVEDSELVLDYIYGSSDETGYFYPIDGQQRLTTLFLLHWYIGSKEHRLFEALNELKKFSYEVRDTTKEFCSALFSLDLNIEKTNKLSKVIKESSNYHSAFDWDPSVTSMLQMLDAIHEQFRTETPLWDRLKNITFWTLRLEDFGLTDDLFVKMNARGERLLKFDTFKSDLESALDKRLKSEPDNLLLAEAIEKWKINIDNEYLDNFWEEFSVELVERNLFRLIMFFAKCLNTAQKKNYYNEFWEIDDSDASYEIEKQFIADNESILLAICKLLERFPRWKDLDDCIKILLAKAKSEIRTITFYEKVKLFSLLYWWAKIDDMRVLRDFSEFFRVLTNYLNSRREYDISTRRFRSQIDQRTFGDTLAFVKTLIEDFASHPLNFIPFVQQSSYIELEYEREKYNCPFLDEIKALEDIPALNRLTQNFFFDGQLYLNADELSTILEKSELKHQYLRIVLSYAPLQYGEFMNLIFDGTTIQTGFKRNILYNDEYDQGTGRCHKFFLCEDNASEVKSFGEKSLTAPQTGSSQIMRDLSIAIRNFAKDFQKKRQASGQPVERILDEIIAERLADADFSNRSSILWYIIKYDSSFFYEPDSTTLLVLRRKNYGTGYDDDNVYHIQCTNRYYSLWKSYNPFYVALSRYLKERNFSVTIDEKSLYTNDNRIYTHPCMLSNGWKIQILKDGDWKITFNGHLPNDPQGLLGLSGDSFSLKNNGSDCIELLVSFIQNYGVYEN